MNLLPIQTSRNALHLEMKRATSCTMRYIVKKIEKEILDALKSSAKLEN